MSWKDRLQVRDLDEGERLRATCGRCGHLHYVSREMLLAVKGAEYLYLSEVERATSCKRHGCWGRVRLMRIRRDDTSAFVGGLA